MISLNTRVVCMIHFYLFFSQAHLFYDLDNLGDEERLQTPIKTRGQYPESYPPHQVLSTNCLLQNPLPSY